MKNVTISDVAKAAGVSVTTVSRYLNGNFAKMSNSTQEKLARVIKELHYHPSASARRMRTDQSKMIGVIVGDISNVFSSLLFRGIYQVLQPDDYSVLLLNANNSAVEERKGISRLLEQQVDGFIIQPSQSHFSDYQFLITDKIPFVTVDRDLVDQPATVGKIMTNNVEASQKMSEELISAGYRQILLISRTTVDISAQIPRIQGFKNAVDGTDTVVTELNLVGHPDRWLADQIRERLKNTAKKTVIVSLMGPLLFKTLAALKQLKVEFPDQIGLASFDDWNWSQFVGSGVDLMQQDPEKMGRQAAKRLLQQIQHPKAILPAVELISAIRVKGHSF